MIESLIAYHARNLDYARRLVADLTPAQWCCQPGSIRNHAAWVIGHLAWVADRVALGRILGGAPQLPAAWDELFNAKSQPTGDASKYPDKAALMQAYEHSIQRVAEALRQRGEAFLDQPTPDEPFSKRFPKVSDALIHLMCGHDAIHLGQLSAWRRAQGLPAV